MRESLFLRFENYLLNVSSICAIKIEPDERYSHGYYKVRIDMDHANYSFDAIPQKKLDAFVAELEK